MRTQLFEMERVEISIRLWGSKLHFVANEICPSNNDQTPWSDPRPPSVVGPCLASFELNPHTKCFRRAIPFDKVKLRRMNQEDVRGSIVWGCAYGL